MNLVVNGASRTVREGASVADLVAALGLSRSGSGIAVALNGEVVPRSEWGTVLGELDRVEILTAVQGG
ncbi:MAG: sulfur carrier protein ThiS [Actinomycetota bacterium]|nr:sulfur carrier protein ThiS [Actinomycetota bacterium]